MCFRLATGRRKPGIRTCILLGYSSFYFFWEKQIQNSLGADGIYPRPWIIRYKKNVVMGFKHLGEGLQQKARSHIVHTD